MTRPALSRRGALLAAILVASAALLAWFLLRATPVPVIRIAEGRIGDVVRGPGQVKARIPVTVSARVTGTILTIEADRGDRVRRGQSLVTLDDRDMAARVAAARAALARSRADLAFARRNEDRDRGVFGKGLISEAAMDATAAQRIAREAEVAAAEQDLEYAATLLSYARVVAPMDGIIVARVAEAGDTVAPGTPILRMVDPRTLQVVARIDESAAGRIRVGMPATIRLRAGGEAKGTVARIALEADAAARELAVDVAFDEPPERFAIDQEAEVAIRIGQERGPIVPLPAVIWQKKEPGVLVVKQGRARFQPIELGVAGDQGVIALRGVGAGDVVVRQAQQVRPGARVRAVEGN